MSRTTIGHTAGMLFAIGSACSLTSENVGSGSGASGAVISMTSPGRTVSLSPCASMNSCAAFFAASNPPPKSNRTAGTAPSAAAPPQTVTSMMWAPRMAFSNVSANVTRHLRSGVMPSRFSPPCDSVHSSLFSFSVMSCPLSESVSVIGRTCDAAVRAPGRA